MVSLNRLDGKTGQTPLDPATVAADRSLETGPHSTLRIPIGPSVPPVTMAPAGVAARRIPREGRPREGHPIENGEETADETTLSQVPQWFGAVALAVGATLLFLLILFAPPDSGEGKVTPAAAQPAAQSRAVPIAARPQASPVPEATLEPLDPPVALEPPPAPKLVEQPPPVSPPPTQVTVDPSPPTGNATGSNRPAGVPAVPVAPTPRPYPSSESAARATRSSGQSTVQTPSPPVRGRVDTNIGSTTPMRPIETKDPYQSP